MKNLLHSLGISRVAKRTHHVHPWVIFSGLAMAFFCSSAAAYNDCEPQVSDLTLNAPDLYVQNFNSLPVGATIGRVFRAGRGYLWQCQNPLTNASLVKVVMQNGLSTTTPIGITAQAFNTSMPGIGVIIGVNGNGTTLQWILPGHVSQTASASQASGGYSYNVLGQVAIQFIKTGDIKSTGFVSGRLGSVFLSVDGDLRASGSLWVHADNKINIINQTCTISNKNKTVQLGTWDTNSLSSSGSSITKPFTIQLDNCPGDSAYTVNIAFSGTSDKTDPTLLALKPGRTSATGVGIQILNDNNQPIALGALPTNHPLPNKSNTFNFALRYKMTKPPVTAGDASGTLTYTLTYM
ncbi:fimbrial protein [Pseudomonas chlororaphis]|uniref:fimbrial protein n=1 Tax=Pseudomonas chlororaphis TaxID=587753 RepID=UPI0039DF61BF